MYCPNCSSQNNNNQNFCRFCGLNLEETAKSLKLQLSFGKKSQKLKKLDKINQIFNYTSICLIVSFVAGLFIFSYFDSFDRNSFKSFLKIALAIYFLFYFSQETTKYYQRQKTENDSNDLIEPTELQSKKTSKLLEEKTFIPISTVTENSTELLYTKNRTKKLS